MYQEKDFKNMRIPLLGDEPEYEKIFKNLPSFISFKDYPTHKKKIVNYILLVYDPSSPFVKTYQNVRKRIDAVCDYTGLSKVKQETLEEVTGYKNENVLRMIDEFVKFINSRLWSMIVTSEATFYEFQTQILTTATGKDSKDVLNALTLKTKILESLDSISTRLDGYYSTLYSNDKELEEVVKTKGISPEGIANGESYA